MGGEDTSSKAKQTKKRRPATGTEEMGQGSTIMGRNGKWPAGTKNQRPVQSIQQEGKGEIIVDALMWKNNVHHVTSGIDLNDLSGKIHEHEREEMTTPNCPRTSSPFPMQKATFRNLAMLESTQDEFQQAAAQRRTMNRLKVRAGKKTTVQGIELRHEGWNGEDDSFDSSTTLPGAVQVEGSRNPSIDATESNRHLQAGNSQGVESRNSNENESPSLDRLSIFWLDDP